MWETSGGVLMTDVMGMDSAGKTMSTKDSQWKENWVRMV